MQEERPAYWVIGLPGDRNLELFADVFRRLGFLFGKMPGDKAPQASSRSAATSSR